MVSSSAALCHSAMLAQLWSWWHVAYVLHRAMEMWAENLLQTALHLCLKIHACTAVPDPMKWNLMQHQRCQLACDTHTCMHCEVQLFTDQRVCWKLSAPQQAFDPHTHTHTPFVLKPHYVLSMYASNCLFYGPVNGPTSSIIWTTSSCWHGNYKLSDLSRTCSFKHCFLYL